MVVNQSTVMTNPMLNRGGVVVGVATYPVSVR